MKMLSLILKTKCNLSPQTVFIFIWMLCYGSEISRLYCKVKDVLIAQKLGVTATQLMEQAPSIASDGSVILGERKSTLYYLDRRTGQLLSSFTSSGANPEAARVGATLDNDGVLPADVVALGKVEFSVYAVHPITNDTLWRLQYAHWRHIRIPGVTVAASVLNLAPGMLPPTSTSAIECKQCIFFSKSNKIIFALLWFRKDFLDNENK